MGIDQFARGGDGLEVAARTGQLRRNFQGYTDDTSEVLIGLGASAISRFPQGYSQNVSATAIYQGHVRSGRFAAARGHVMTRDDRIRAMLIEQLMCDFRADIAEIMAAFGEDAAWLPAEAARVAQAFGDFVSFDGEILAIQPEGRPAARLVARAFDAYALDREGHSHAI
ncbi:MAG: hypothetical protein JJU40_08005 [Rhodobacteraceae bacterium]|nr:hypothetical protein [Paracoccaceae bacterium]